MTEASKSTALELLKVRLNRADHILDDYLAVRIDAAVGELEGKGIALTDESRDIVLVTDYAAWHYASRDKGETVPMWLSLKIRERWLQEVRNDT